MNRVLIGLVLLLALSLRLYGIGFGLPSQDHSRSYNPDEWTPLKLLQNMDPKSFDFNPDYFDNPTFQYYMYGAALGSAHLVGYVNVLGSEKYYFENPEQLGRMILIGRLFSVILGTATVFLVYLLALRLGLGTGFALLAALILALYPSHIAHGKFMSVNVPVTFWIVLTFLGLEAWIREGRTRVIVLTGIAAGLALSTKYTGGLLVPFVALTAGLRWWGWKSAGRVDSGRAGKTVVREALTVFGALLVSFFMTSPYFFIDFGQVWAMLESWLMPIFLGTGGGVETVDGSGLVLGKMYRVFAHASTPTVLIAALVGGGMLAFQLTRARLLVLAWVVVFVLIALRAGPLVSDSRCMPVYPFLAILAAACIQGLWRRRAAGFLAGLLVVLSLAVWDVSIVGRFVGNQQQELATDWLLENTRGDEVLFAAGGAIFYHPNIVQREYHQAKNAENYDRLTEWRLIDYSDTDARVQAPEIVVLTLWIPHVPAGSPWLEDPDYEVVAHFPGKIHLFGKRIFADMDIYDAETWILRRKF